ncbi:MAG: ATP synthase F1 subunit epsilon [Dysgonamonadaceae bacterium]|jgi:F-type H+-transporting ATPase subunit epsilon|nr:ATP synthase F1 subunit epsilon [Dysgonamonadaceae bacterium]MDD3309385.1 ATP synthase F1 subunit epsilon [Dysgonamonadaceae bacterium]MDD3900327.1 ATP synthase F1 subunit epsilon [Dysgonamonadaceae bacterium]MDD4398402.1 ATP synthase F1 subunit epsilon [Dysgonamonadaceae bacterium]MEA5080106.1 ATP synthase F1 subunit epsilon [Dysgonamonadaceae bacterium]
MKLEVLTPEKKYFSGEVTSVSVPGTIGSFSMLNDHAPIISLLKKGKISYVHNEETTTLSILNGVVEMNNNKITILIESIKE